MCHFVQNDKLEPGGRVGPLRIIKNYYSRLNFRHNQKTDRSNRVASSADDQTTCRIQVVNILLGKDNRVSTLLQRKITIHSKSSQ